MIAAEKACGEYLFCVDSHVLIGNSTLERSIEFMDSHPNIGFGHPPMRWAKDGPQALRQAIVAAPGQTFYKMWNSRRINKDRTIFWSFMPWICNREWYLNTLRGYGSHATHHVSWGGAEMLQQIKSWMLGYPNWYIKSNPVIHIGPYNSNLYKAGVEKRKPYKSSGEFPVGFGVILAMYVLGGEQLGYKYAKMAGQRIRKMHKIKVDDWWEKAIELGKAEHEWLMENKKYSLRELLDNHPWNN